MKNSWSYLLRTGLFAFLIIQAVAPTQPSVAGDAQGQAGVATDTCWATGSLNDSTPLSVADIVYILRVLSGSEPAPENLYQLDLNGDCIVDQADADLIAQLLELGPGSLPQYPVPTCCSPEIHLACPIALTGDINNSGSLTAADIVYVVAYLFRGYFGPEPCPAVADLNCDGAVTASDIILLVNYLFKGGPPPCDVCALIPDVWNCPY